MKKILALPLLSISSLLILVPNARADSAIVFGGVPVDLKISAVGEKTVRIELRPVDQGSNSNFAASSWTLADFPTTEKLHSHDLASEKKISVGALRLTIQPRPLGITVRRADGSLVQEVVFNPVAGTNAISFRTDAPVLGLGEGGD